MRNREKILASVERQVDNLSRAADTSVATRKAYLLGYVNALHDMGVISANASDAFVERIESVLFTD